MPRAQFLVRPVEHELEEQSERFFHGHLPNNWICEKQVHDYGIDLRVDIFEGRAATGLEFVVQLKGSRYPSRNATETVRLRRATYNYLRRKLQVAMLVKFVADETEAYWIWVRDIPVPTGPWRTFSVHIPRENRLSRINWDEIREHIRGVTDAKLAAARVKEMRSHNVR